MNSALQISKRKKEGRKIQKKMEATSPSLFLTGCQISNDRVMSDLFMFEWNWVNAVGYMPSVHLSLVHNVGSPVCAVRASSCL